MKNQKKTELKVGITVIFSIIILLWILGWAKNFSLNSNEKTLSISFQNVAGLMVGDIVSVQGIKEGFVRSIKNENNSVLVQVTLTDAINLNADAQFSIMMIDLMGEKKIEISPGISNVKIDYSKVQKGKFLGDISTTMATFGAVQDDFVDMIFEIKETLSSFNKVMNDTEFTDKLHNSVTSLNKLIVKTDKIISENGSSFSELIKNSNKLVSNSNQFIVENSIDAKKSIENINKLLNNTDKLVVKLNGFFDEVENKQNNLGKLMYDDELVDDLSVTLKQLKDLSKTINEQLNGKGVKVDANVF